MTVKELKEYLETLDDDATVMITADSNYDVCEPLSLNMHFRYYPKINQKDLPCLHITP